MHTPLFKFAVNNSNSFYLKFLPGGHDFSKNNFNIHNKPIKVISTVVSLPEPKNSREECVLYED